MILPPPDATASLHVSPDGRQELAVRVVANGRASYRVIVDCVRTCRRQLHQSIAVEDSPMGLLDRDDGLIYSLWGTGSAYRVRVFRVTTRGLLTVLSAGSRGVPDFSTAPDGAPMVRTYDGDSIVGPLHTVRWRYRGGAFVRDPVSATRR